MLSPITLFVYNRPEHTRKTIEALQKNYLAKDSELFIFSDGTKDDKSKKGIEEVRSYLKNIAGFKNVYITERKENLGLAKSITTGVTEIINRYGKIIVLEDDIVTSPYFLKYMNDALNLYEKEEKVMHISGYMFPLEEKLPETFFYGPTSCWGWSTWSRAWKYFNNDAKILMDKINSSGRKNEFDINGRAGFISQLKNNAKAKINTWAIKWYASVFLEKGLSLHPGRSLVKNIGHDNSGVNCGNTNIYDTENFESEIRVRKIELAENARVKQMMKEFYHKINPNILTKIFNKFRITFHI